MALSRWLFVVLFTTLVVFALDPPPQCDQQVFARSNPGLCSYYPFPDFDQPAGGGGGGSGGLGGLIGRVLHDLGL